MLLNTSDKINAENIERDLLGLTHPEAIYHWVIAAEQQAIARDREEAQQRVNKLVDASNQAYAPASYLLGVWYLNGHYVDQNSMLAAKCFEFACQSNDANAEWMLAQLYREGIKGVVNLQKADEHLKRAIELKHPDAILSLIKQNHAEDSLQTLIDSYIKNKHQASLKYLVESDVFPQKQVQSALEALANDDSFICAILAYSYIKSGDEEKAFKYAQASQEQNNPFGCFVRAIIEQQSANGSREIAHEFLLKAAEFGHIEAAYLAAIEILQDIDLIEDETDRRKAAIESFNLLTQAAMQGHSEAQFSLAQCYRYGLGTEKNSELGLHWLDQAAQKHNPDAEFELSMTFPIEHESHHHLLSSSAEKGHAQAMLCMYVLEQKRNQMQQALEWLHKAKDQAVPRAYYLLAQHHKNGLAGEVDWQMVIDYLKEAADLGDVDAYFELYQAYSNGTGVRKNKKTALKYLNLAKENQHLEAAAIES